MLLIAYLRGGTSADYITALIAVAVAAVFGVFANIWEGKWVKKAGKA